MMTSRRGLLGLFGASVVAAVIPLVDFEEALESARPAQLTLIDWALREPSADFHGIAHLLSQTNDLLDDIPWRT